MTAPTSMEPAAYTFGPSASKVCTLAPGEAVMSLSAPVDSVHWRPSVDDHKAKLPSMVPAANSPNGPAATIDMHDGLSLGGTEAAVKGAPVPDAIQTAACWALPMPVQPTATVVFLYLEAAMAWLGSEAGANAVEDHVIASGDDQTVDVGEPAALVRLPKTSHGPLSCGAITAASVAEAPPPIDNADARLRSHVYGEGANCRGGSVVLVVVEVDDDVGGTARE